MSVRAATRRGSSAFGFFAPAFTMYAIGAPPLSDFAHSIEGLRPYPSLLLLALPTATVEPLKLVAVALAGEGHWVVGTAGYSCAPACRTDAELALAPAADTSENLSRQSATEAGHQDAARRPSDQIDAPRGGGPANEIQMAGMAFVAVRTDAHFNLPADIEILNRQPDRTFL